MTLDEIIQLLESHGRKVDIPFLRAVHDFSARMHENQTRRSGEPYMVHPLGVAFLLADLRFDQTCVAVGLLHDVVEDTLTTREVLEATFGSEVAELVDGVTKIGRHEYVRRDDAQAETFRKMILASAKDIRVIVVKLADRLHNMQTLEHLSVDARRRISRETIEIYAPIAHRLGMARVRGDLEDLAFFHLYPLQFAELHSKIEEKKKIGEGATQKIRDLLVQSLATAGIEAEISFRVKRYYSIWEKLRRQGIDISQIYDYLAFRIVTRDLRDTYAALGIVHQNWRPIPGRFKDYIAMPKPNLYQSLHTTVVGRDGQPFEVQIRTREMDLVAEEGIAAHWRYKEGRIEGKEADAHANIAWLRQLLEWQKEVPDSRDFLNALRVDLYPDEVYAFSPRGDVFALPRGATPLDYAYRVHTDLGHHCAGARVNGKLVPIRTPLQNGDMVEIVTNAQRNPSRDWLSFVATSRAKSKIRQWLSSQQKQRAMEIGRRIFEKETKKYRLNAKKLLESPELARYAEEEGMGKADDLLARIGFGKTEVRQVLARVVGDEKLSDPAPKPGVLRQAVGRLLPFGGGPIAVKGQGDLLAYLAKCCNPLPGEDIVGYVTRGRGVSVHSLDCPNVKNLLYNPDREIEVDWARSKDDVYRISLTIETEERQGMLARLTEAITKSDSNITQILADAETGKGRIEVVVELRDRKHLDKLLRVVGAVPGVLRVDRRMSGNSAGEVY